MHDIFYTHTHTQKAHEVQDILDQSPYPLA